MFWIALGTLIIYGLSEIRNWKKDKKLNQSSTNIVILLKEPNPTNIGKAIVEAQAISASTANPLISQVNALNEPNKEKK